MAGFAAAAVLGLLVGGSLVAGAAWGATGRMRPRTAAAISSFGAGAMLAAVALELVPEADAAAGTWPTAGGLLAGTLLYVGADAWLTRGDASSASRRSRHARAAGAPAPESGDGGGELIAVGLTIDGVPESIALGLTAAEGEVGLALLSGIVVGNIAEACAAAQPIVAEGRSRRFAVGLLGAIGLGLAIATVLGATVLADVDPALVGVLQAIAAGAVLAVVTISIIPHAFAHPSRDVSVVVAMATVLGFITGYLLT